ncbi:MAG TPA: BolA/IbaG family iron-sulfur metabolism protein [Oculatellaceae cyanobacterium]
MSCALSLQEGQDVTDGVLGGHNNRIGVLENQMISHGEIEQLIQSKIPGARVETLDKTGMSDHYIIRVTSERFEGVNLMDRHRMVMAGLQPAMEDGRLHAAEIQTASR